MGISESFSAAKTFFISFVSSTAPHSSIRRIVSGSMSETLVFDAIKLMETLPFTNYYYLLYNLTYI